MVCMAWQRSCLEKCKRYFSPEILPVTTRKRKGSNRTMDETELVNGIPHYLVRQRDTKEKLGISHKTFYKYAKKHNWQSKEGAAGAIIWMIPQADYQSIRDLYRTAPERFPEESAPGSEDLELEKSPVRAIPDEYIGEVRRGYELAIDALKEQNATLRDQMKSLSNELDARNSAIIKYKDQEKDREAFLTTIREEFEKQKKSRPWWRPWG